MKIVIRLAGVLLAIVVVGALGLLAWRASMQHKIAGELKIGAPNGIDESKFIRINGQDEWITIRGQDRSKPIILFLHGGPSEANSEFPRLFQPFEKDFVFVQWDQPGAGKTWIRAGKHQPALTLDGMAADGVQVADFVRRELRQPKVILIGQDWGSLLAVRMAQLRPDLFQAMVGTAQAISWLGEQDEQYAYTKRRATAAKDRKTLDLLAKVGPPPYRSLEAYRNFGDAFESYKPADDLAAEKQLEAWLVMTPSLTIPEAFGWVRSLRTGEETLTPVMMGVDLRRMDTRFEVPVYVIDGADSIICPPSLVADYMSKISAPAKRLDLIPGAAHMVIWQHPQAFLKVLRRDLGMGAGPAS